MSLYVIGMSYCNLIVNIIQSFIRHSQVHKTHYIPQNLIISSYLLMIQFNSIKMSLLNGVNNCRAVLLTPAKQANGVKGLCCDHFQCRSNIYSVYGLDQNDSQVRDKRSIANTDGILLMVFFWDGFRVLVAQMIQGPDGPA